MAITSLTVTNLATGQKHVAWTSDLGSPPADGYRVYFRGRLIATGTPLESWDFSIQAGQQLIVEVLDDYDAVPVSIHPDGLTLGWRRVAAAEKYRVEQYVSAAWVARRTVIEDGTEWYSHETETLADVTAHQWRIVPVDANGNDGTPISFTVLMVRYPDKPIEDTDVDAAFTYSAVTKKATIDTTGL